MDGGRSQAREAAGENRHVVRVAAAAGGNRHVVRVAAVAEVGKHREEAAAAEEEEVGDHRDVVVVEAGNHHGAAAAAAAHTCRTGEGEGNEASCPGEAGKGQCHSQCDSRDRAFQSGGEGRRGAHHLDDEDEVQARGAHDVRLHRLTTQRPSRCGRSLQ